MSLKVLYMEKRCKMGGFKPAILTTERRDVDRLIVARHKYS